MSRTIWLIPLLFALGTAALTMVGTNFGAGQIARAERIAWISALFAAGLTELIGALAAIFPRAWLSLLPVARIVADDVALRGCAQYLALTDTGVAAA